MGAASSATEEENVEMGRVTEEGVREMGRVEVRERERATVAADAEPERERVHLETEVEATARMATTEETAGVVVRRSRQVPEEVVPVCPV